MKWFGIKMIFRSSCMGKPQNTDKSYNKNVDLVEEMVLLVKARNVDSAISKAEKEAKEYSSDTIVNPYGQKIKTKYLGCCEAFELFDNPDDKVEAYSSTRLISKKTADKKIKDVIFGAKESLMDGKKRKNFLNKDFN